MSDPRIKVIVHKAEEGGYWAEVDGMPGCITEGDTLEELHQNVKDAVFGWLLAQLPPQVIAKPQEVKRFENSPRVWHGNTRRELLPI